MKNIEAILIDKITEYYPDFQVSEHGTILSVTQLTLDVFKFPETLKTSEIEHFFSMLNSLYLTDDRNFLDLINICILEILTDNEMLQTISFNNLRGEALKAYKSLFEDRYLKLV